jgi:hypothetical protein
LLLHNFKNLETFNLSLLLYIVVKIHKTTTNPDQEAVVLQNELLLQRSDHVAVHVQLENRHKNIQAFLKL